jgi:2-polyprenyl-3-methyl-5-hydroxy-6-metoxy-1,4-benzoquinol methylase
MSTNCHLCKNKLFFDPVLELVGMPKAAQYYPEQNEFAQDSGVTLTICQCSSCGLVQHTMKPVDYFKEVITAASLSPKSRLSRLNQMKDFADRFGLAGKKILDIGTGKGEMVEVLEEAGMIGIGLEASPSSIEEGKSASRKVVQGYIGEVSEIDGAPFDAFISLNYLEHLPEPGRVIQNIYKNTTDNAVGFVTVPNFEYLLKTRSLYEFVPDHISYFTKKTLAYAFETNGFEVLECLTINEDNDIAAIVKKRKSLDLSMDYQYVETLIRDFQEIVADCKSKDKKVATWGAGHRTLALLALSKVKDIEYVIDSAKFKQGKFTPVSHFPIVAPEHLKEDKVDLVIVMVPGLYPGEVIKTLEQMDIGAQIAVLRDNKIEFN